MSIAVFCRLKPSNKQYEGIELDKQDDCDFIKMHVTKEHQDIIDHTKQDFKFKFTKVFAADTPQEDIFTHLAKPVADNVLEGYNGTVFAYGQTGSGKTFTITGGAENYNQRGIIPRTLEYLFQYFEDHPDREYQAHVSYLELYNEVGFDLLGQEDSINHMEDLPKIKLMERDNEVFLNNLSLKPVETSEQALDALFVGDTNRMIAETPMNMASTRSHCIFTIHIKSRGTGGSVWRKGKLHLVDLAGSERIKKTNVEGILLKEAKFINLSLHFLEQVIVALGEKSRHHIPYRNSLLTSVLRDSLGGNCKTTMIATMSSESGNLAESISTGRFSQRVALVKNDARLNEELDPKLEIRRLKQEVSSLKAEIALLQGDVDMSVTLTEEEIENVHKQVDDYITAKEGDGVSLTFGDMRKIQCANSYFKKLVETAREHARPQTTDNDNSDDNSSAKTSNSADMDALRNLLEQRDNEIRILVAKLRRERSLHGVSDDKSRGNTPTIHAAPSTTTTTRELSPEEKRKYLNAFKQENEAYTMLEKTKSTLKILYAQAQTLGQEVQQAKDIISEIKAHIQQHQQEHFQENVQQGLETGVVEDPILDEMHGELTVCQTAYKEKVGNLRSLKREIDHLKHLFEKQKVQFQKQFQAYLDERTSLPQEEN
eukprot:m.47187 g.47187  ORF g.47187 m.47187 type:complete len:656 (-) comp7317_c0_seq2:176-2143(-)